MDITRIVSGAILLIIAIWCFTTFPSDLNVNLIIKIVAGGFFSCFGIILLAYGFEKRAAMTALGAILLASSIFVATGIPDLAVKIIACGLLLGIGVILLVCGLKKGKLKINIPTLLGILIGIYILLTGYVLIPMPTSIRQILFYFATILVIALSVLGVVLIILTLKRKVKGALKWFLLLAGIASVALFLCLLLHNFVHTLFIQWFSTDFWQWIGMKDESFFFILAHVICPLVFLIGFVGSAVMLIKKR